MSRGTPDLHTLVGRIGLQYQNASGRAAFRGRQKCFAIRYLLDLYCRHWKFSNPCLSEHMSSYKNRTEGEYYQKVLSVVKLLTFHYLTFLCAEISKSCLPINHVFKVNYNFCSNPLVFLFAYWGDKYIHDKDPENQPPR